MITIDEIKNVSFRKAGRQGYMAEDVDAFIDEVIVAFEQLKKEKTNLVHKIDVLATRVEQYRADEKQSETLFSHHRKYLTLASERLKKRHLRL